MPVKKSGTHGHKPTLPTADPKVSPGPDNAGAHGAPQGETQFTSSGQSETKGVHNVGDDALPTGGGGGLEVGTPSEVGLSETDRHRTLEEQLREKGLVNEEGEDA